MVTGVAEGFTKKLELVGVGYKAEKKGKTLVLNLGFSHSVELEDPEGIKTEAAQIKKYQSNRLYREGD